MTVGCRFSELVEMLTEYVLNLNNFEQLGGDGQQTTEWKGFFGIRYVALPCPALPGVASGSSGINSTCVRDVSFKSDGAVAKCGAISPGNIVHTRLTHAI